MSSTAPSYIDDGHSFARRIPPAPPLTTASRWLNSAHPCSSAASVYTGSYVDDGLDLLPTTAPGFGRIDTRFYAHKRRRDRRDEVWSDDIARAVSGDMHSSLAKMQGLAGVQVKRGERSDREEKERRERKKGVVSVPAPLTWGTFVIKPNDGRVIVVDKRGEYYSGEVDAEWRGRGDVGLTKDRSGGRWIRAARTLTPSPPTVDTFACKQDSYARSREKTSSRPRTSKLKSQNKYEGEKKHRPRASSPVTEPVYNSDDHIKLSTASPTDFFMTGGLSGWPSPTRPSHTALSSAAVPIVPHAITWDTSTPSPRSATSSKSASRNHSTHTLPHGWPSPPASPTRSACSSTFTSLKAGPSEPRSRGRGCTDSRQNGNEYPDEREETRSNYQHPDIIEVIYDETPPGEVSYSQADWGGKAVSVRSWSNTHQNGKSKGGAWEGGGNRTAKRFGRSGAGSDLGWDGSAKGDDWKGSRAGSKFGSAQGWSNDGRRSTDGDDAWDGFERPKTTSEVSVAGGSDRSWPASQHSVHTQLDHRTDHSRTSRRSRHSHTDWPTSQAGSKAGSAFQDKPNWPAGVHRGEDSKQSNNSWPKSSHGSEKDSPTQYKNGFDEDNATYLNETWGGIPVRVASPNKSVTRWY